MLTSRGQAFSFPACGLINRNTELHSRAKGKKKKKRQIIQGLCFPEGLVFCVSAGSQNMMDSCVLPQNSEGSCAADLGRGLMFTSLILPFHQFCGGCERHTRHQAKSCFHPTLNALFTCRLGHLSHRATVVFNSQASSLRCRDVTALPGTAPQCSTQAKPNKGSDRF